MSDFVRRMVPVKTPRGSGEIAVLDFGDPARPVDVIFSHGNGFNARTHRSALADLGLRVLAVDQRGHGATTLPYDPEGRTNWSDLVEDLTILMGELALDRPVVLAGHSMGGAISLMATPGLGDQVKGLVLLDPVIPRVVRTRAEFPPFLVSMIEGAKRRRRQFDSLDAAYHAYHARGPFKTWPDAALRDYVEAGFRPVDGGGVELACDPLWESSNFGAQEQDSLGALLGADKPVRLLKAAEFSATNVEAGEPDIAANPNLRITAVEGTTHSLPMERPDLVRAALLEAVG